MLTSKESVATSVKSHPRSNRPGFLGFPPFTPADGIFKRSLDFGLLIRSNASEKDILTTAVGKINGTGETFLEEPHGDRQELDALEE